ncbi:MAG: hypothetical protein E5V89_09780 [Mesorhizobium sp.]|nr:MAG: hypothetical protein E5V89_09780 [Mesorhizobium sp.]
MNAPIKRRSLDELVASLPPEVAMLVEQKVIERLEHFRHLINSGADRVTIDAYFASLKQEEPWANAADIRRLVEGGAA